ncbi:MAG TPA: hypothetical protein VM848_19505 [Acidimicrobiia bacterium]|nr:hypothetical protein [Acidimicrobiia bacterium]
MIRRWLVLVGWLVFVAASIGGLHRLGNAFPLELVLDSGGPLEPALAAVLRVAGLAVGYWLAVSTVLYLIGRAGRLPGAIRAVGWATIGPVRRLIDGLAASAVVVGVGLSATAIAMTGPGYIPVPAGDPIETEVPVPGSILPGTLFLPTHQIPVPEVGDPESVAPQNTVPNEPTEVVVQSGDHMWSLAEQRLAQVRGRGVSDTEIAPYWLKVIGVNLSRIRSGDPDLIFPGEILSLPEIDP